MLYPLSYEGETSAPSQREARRRRDGGDYRRPLGHSIKRYTDEVNDMHAQML